MRRVSAVLLAAVLAAGLAGCTQPPAGASAPASVDGDCPQASVALADLPLVDDVRTVEGGSTACLSSDAIEPVADETAPTLPAR
ncbi:hypothetical protein [uncultured Microbacterium sp.]|uniref:hypothetical protein n=1 Tax=uncultured Microbacterium sp. TaxID=191216 RepID=UPI0028DD1958|nr:hypothetical protein [uncultured Microbacterium sp.]